MELRVPLRVGTKLVAFCAEWIVVGLRQGSKGEELYLVDAALSEDERSKTTPAVFLLHAVLQAQDFAVTDVDYVTGALASAFGLLDDLPYDVRKKVEEREAHLLEVETGFRSGDPETPRKNEPRSRYDPAKTTLTERAEAKAEEMGISLRHFWNLRRAYRRAGRRGLAPKQRQLREPEVPPEFKVIVEELRSEATHSSTIGKEAFLAQARHRFYERHADKKIELPSLATQLRFLNGTEDGRGTFGTARRRQSDAARPKGSMKKWHPVNRPNQVLFIDSSPLNIFGVDPLTGEPISLDLYLSLCGFSRRGPAFRLTTLSPKALDAALLLADAVFGMPEQPDWPEIDLRYGGIPEHLVFDERSITNNENESRASRRRSPIDQVVGDHALILKSEVFRQALAHFRASFHSARIKDPGDKSHIERMFRTIRQGFEEYLKKGYKGSGVEHRGKYVEAEAFYYPREIERRLAWWLTNVYHVRSHKGFDDIPGLPDLRGMTPNQMWDLGMATVGEIWIPPARDVYFQLLPVEWRKITDKGIEIDSVIYDDEGDLLTPYRNRDSRHRDQGGKYPIRRDTRDISKVWFRDEKTLRFHPIYRSGSNYPRLPLTQEMLVQAKALIRAAGESPRDPAIVNRRLDDMVRLVHADEARTAMERRKARNARHDMAEALLDVAKSTEPDFLRALAQQQADEEAPQDSGDGDEVVNPTFALDITGTPVVDYDDDDEGEFDYLGLDSDLDDY